jgi:hypothetical protein
MRQLYVFCEGSKRFILLITLESLSFHELHHFRCWIDKGCWWVQSPINIENILFNHWSKVLTPRIDNRSWSLHIGLMSDNKAMIFLTTLTLKWRITLLFYALDLLNACSFKILIINIDILYVINDRFKKGILSKFI